MQNAVAHPGQKNEGASGRKISTAAKLYRRKPQERVSHHASQPRQYNLVLCLKSLTGPYNVDLRRAAFTL